MSTPNAKTRQLSLPEVLRDGLTGIGVPSSDSESGDPSVLHGTTKAGAKRPQKRHQLTGDTPNLHINKRINQQKHLQPWIPTQEKLMIHQVIR